MKAPTTLAEAQEIVSASRNFPPVFDDPYANYLIDVATAEACGEAPIGPWHGVKDVYYAATQARRAA